MRNFIFISFVLLVGCAPNSVTFMSPKGAIGNATIDGCGQIPSTFQYEMEGAKYKVALHYNSVYLVVEVVDGGEVKWYDNEITAWVNGASHTLKVDELIKDNRAREPCGGFTESFNCKSYRNYYLNVEIETIRGAEQVKVKPPVPMVNNQPFNVSEIQYKTVTKTLMQAINC